MQIQSVMNLEGGQCVLYTDVYMHGKILAQLWSLSVALVSVTLPNLTPEILI